MAERQFYEFGRFRMDSNGHMLFCGEQVVPLPPKVADVLFLMVRNAGHVVEKEDLLHEVWPDTAVEEGSLTRAISILRKVLEENDQGQEYIATVPKRGYRFVVPVQLVEDPSPVAEAGIPDRPDDHHNRRAIALVTALVVVLVASYFLGRSWWTRPHVERGKVMLAVLPFQNLTGDPSQEFVTDGLTEEMITQLGGVKHEQLGVIARTSAMTYKGTAKSVGQIGRELGVSYILEGSVRRWGDRVRISAQLIQTRDQTHIWAKNYESDVTNILKLQSDVAQEVAREISLTLTPEERARVTTTTRVDPQVYELCLRGRYEWNKRTESGLNQAISYYQQAIDRQPSYAPAHAGLADAYAVLPYFSEASANDTFSKAKSAAEHALHLDETLAEAHTTLGLVESAYFNRADGEREYKRALELNPNYATVHHWYAFLLWATNRHEEALASMEQARQLDPLSLIISADEGRLLCASGQHDRAITLLKQGIELDGNFAEVHRVLALAYLRKGQSSQAISEARRGFELDPNDFEQATLGYIYAVAGRQEEARKVLADLSKPGRRGLGAPIFLVYVYVGLDQRDLALASLKRAYRENFPSIYGSHETILDPQFQSDPRFQDLLRRLEMNHNGPKSQ